jgi:ribosomal protein S18 acetylase RimI-like enzyme
MEIQELAATTANLRPYAAVPADRLVDSRLRLDLLLPGSPTQTLVADPITHTYTHSEDAHSELQAWTERDDLERLTLLCAFEDERCVGGTILALHPEGSWFFPQEVGLAVLWDLRVHPDYRRRGIASALLRKTIEVARRRNCTRLGIETQDSNDGACRLYASIGAVLGAVRRGAYSNRPDDAALLWYVEVT